MQILIEYSDERFVFYDTLTHHTYEVCSTNGDKFDYDTIKKIIEG